MDNLGSIKYARFATLDPAYMSDIERALWGNDLGRGWIDPFYLKGYPKWCKDYWSEPLSMSNADKRNEWFRAGCWKDLDQAAEGFNTRMGDYIRQAEDQQSGIFAPRTAVNQYVRLMNWMDITGHELLALQEPPHELVRRLGNAPELEEIFHAHDIPTSYSYDGEIVREAEDNGTLRWWGLGPALNHAWENCALYYPQLFTGRWIPLDVDDMTPEPLPELSDLALHGPGRSMFVPDEYTRPR